MNGILLRRSACHTSLKSPNMPICKEFCKMESSSTTIPDTVIAVNVGWFVEGNFRFNTSDEEQIGRIVKNSGQMISYF